MRLGVFGGTFDPVHFGHLLLAEMCREQCGLDQVWFVPASVPPHKQHRYLTPGRQRMAMLELAVGGHDAFFVSPIEIERGGVSYTVDTLTQVKAQQPDAELFFLMGADSLKDLPTWREPARICELAIPIVVRRTGSPPPDYSYLVAHVPTDRVELFRQYQVEMPIVEFSSHDLRLRVAESRSIRYRTPRAVERYIETNRLYREAVRTDGSL